MRRRCRVCSLRVLIVIGFGLRSSNNEGVCSAIAGRIDQCDFSSGGFGHLNDTEEPQTTPRLWVNKGIPFIKIADHVDVNFHAEAKRVSGLHWPLAIAWFGKAEVGWQFPGSIEVDATNEEPACPADDTPCSCQRTAEIRSSSQARRPPRGFLLRRVIRSLGRDPLGVSLVARG